jgi:antitoxin ParD1/3/4
MSMTTKTIHISLPESLKEYMDERVNEEHYSTLSDYIRALVREDQKRRAEERLEKLLLEGLESGRGVEYGSQEWDAFWERIHARINKARAKKTRA